MEQIFNLFIFSDLDIITEVGVVVHDHNGSDQDKISFLQANVESDFLRVQRFSLPQNFLIKSNDTVRKGIDYMSYRDLCNQGLALLIFQEVLDYYNAPDDLLCVITPVKNGIIFIEGVENIKPSLRKAPEFVHIDQQDAWFIGYIDENGFHFDRLINDDFFEAIRVLYNSGHHVSAMKLLMICLDTLAFLEYGDVSKNFQLWLSEYTDLASLNITEEELWEFRNSILHMTNLDSRKVKSGQVKRLLFYVAHEKTSYIQESDEGKYFKFKDLINVVANAIAKWAQTYNLEKGKINIFIGRYDRIISDKRMTGIRFKENSKE